MGNIKEALAALDKSTKGDWWACCSDEEAHSHFVFAGEGEAAICSMLENDPTDPYDKYDPLEDIVTWQERQANAKLLEASRKMAIWITKALPYLDQLLSVSVCDGGVGDEEELFVLIKEARK